jgi:16S rRNA (guanine527-N7)-methyltransferase
MNATADPLESVLEDGIQTLGLTVEAGVRAQLMDYLNLLDRWNKTYNLTAIREREKMVSHHLLDALAVVPVLQPVIGRHAGIVDIGSGGGVPGVIFALMFPQVPVVLVEPVSKKCAFLRQCGAQLLLPNLTVLEQRVQHLLFADLPGTDIRPNLFTCRAFTRLIEFARQALPLCTDGSLVAAMKAARVDDEVAEVRAATLTRRAGAADSPLGIQLTVDRVDPLQVPGINAPRSVVLMRANEIDMTGGA